MFGRVVALAALGGFLFGYDLGLIGGAILGISDAFHISDATKEAIVGAAKLGAFFGTFVGGVAMLRYGRRKAISLQAAFFVSGPVLMAAAPGPAALIVGRLLVGLGIGASAIVVPAYLAEIAPAKNRGMVVQMYEVMLTLGMLAAVLVNLALSTAAGGAAWRWMVGLPAIPGAFLLASLVSLPESPRWLVMRGQLDQALATLHTISSSNSSSRRSRGRSRGRSRQAAAAAVEAGALQLDPGSAAEDAAWLNATPEARAAGTGASRMMPSSAEQQAVEQAEDELLLLWSSVQKEQAAGLELRAAAAAAASGAASRPPSSQSVNGNGTHTAIDVDARVLVSTVAANGVSAHGMGSSAQHNRFVPQAAPAAAFTLDDHDSEEQQQPQHNSSKSLSSSQHRQQQQQYADAAAANVQPNPGDVREGPAAGAQVHNSNNKFKALQQKLHLGGRGSTAAGGGDADGQQQQQQLLLGPDAISSSGPDAGDQQLQSQQPAAAQQRPFLAPPNQHHQHQQQQRNHHHHFNTNDSSDSTSRPVAAAAVEPGRESNVFISLWAMLKDIRAVAKGPECAAFAIACCLAVFDQATASTAIINYAPEVLANRLGVRDTHLAILYPAAIALAKVVGTLVAAATVDRHGRKPLLVWGGVGCAVFLALTGVALGVGSVALYLSALCLFIFSFSMSWAGLYWVVVSEIFSMGAKSPATSAATSLLFLTGAAVNFVYLSLIQWMGGAAFGVFAVVAAGSAVYVWRRVPETKGKTLAEIQALLAPVDGSGAGSAGGGGGGQQQWERGGWGGSAGCKDGDGSESGSPMLPITRHHHHQQQQYHPFSSARPGGGGGDTGLVELRQLMVADAGAGRQQQQQQQHL